VGSRRAATDETPTGYKPVLLEPKKQRSADQLNESKA